MTRVLLVVFSFFFVFFKVAQAQVASHSSTLSSTTPSKPNSISLSLQPVGKPLLRVNGVVLTDRDLAREILKIFPYARQHNSGIPPSMEFDLRQGAAKMMVFEELVYQDAKRRGMTVATARVDAANLEFQKQFGAPAAYQQFVKEEYNGDRKLLRTHIERSILIEDYLQQQVYSKAAVSDADLKTYYDQNPDKFRIPESFAIQSISILPPQHANAEQLKEAHKHAENALKQARGTKSYEEFGVLAEKISEDDFRVMMGDHKAVDRVNLPPAILKACQTMQPGQVSEIIEFAPNAFTIIRLNAHIAAGEKSFDSVKDSLREQLTKQKSDQLQDAVAAKLSKNAKIEKL